MISSSIYIERAIDEANIIWELSSINYLKEDELYTICRIADLYVE